jgi:hypothetical protein
MVEFWEGREAGQEHLANPNAGLAINELWLPSQNPVKTHAYVLVIAPINYVFDGRY